MFLHLVISISVLLSCASSYLSLKLAQHVPQRSQNFGTKLKIHCLLIEETSSRPEFIWFKQDALLSSGSRYRIETSEEESILVIDKLIASDSANYTCTVRNNLQEKASQTTILTVKG